METLAPREQGIKRQHVDEGDAYTGGGTIGTMGADGEDGVEGDRRYVFLNYMRKSLCS